MAEESLELIYLTAAGGTLRSAAAPPEIRPSSASDPWRWVGGSQPRRTESGGGAEHLLRNSCCSTTK